MDYYGTPEEHIKKLERRVKNLIKNNRKLQEENKGLTNNLSDAEFKIKTELEPRIKQEERSYDNWATSPTKGMDDCMQDCSRCMNTECEGHWEYWVEEQHVDIDFCQDELENLHHKTLTYLRLKDEGIFSHYEDIINDLIDVYDIKYEDLFREINLSDLNDYYYYFVKIYDSYLGDSYYIKDFNDDRENLNEYDGIYVISDKYLDYINRL
jgi:regulator of replication initiation timing